jgi:hypothetical protein
MHGDLRHEEHIILTSKDYEEFLDRYPVVATHLSAMLITRTPLFIGYSLSDPDFNNIRMVVRSRLGRFERMAYIIQFDQTQETLDAALTDHLHVISLSTAEGRTRDELLAEFFVDALRTLDAKSGASLRKSRPDAFEPIGTAVIKNTAGQSKDISPILSSTSRACFVMMPFGEIYDRVYRTLIVPAAEESGLVVIRADEMTTPGLVIEQIRVAIQQTRVCIADVSERNPNVLWELGYAQALNKPTILLASDVTSLPFDIAAMRVLRYGSEPEQRIPALRLAIQHLLSRDLLQEAERLLASGMFRASIAVSSVILEHALRGLMLKHGLNPRPRMAPLQILTLLRAQEILDEQTSRRLRDAIDIRNAAIHRLDEPTAEDAHKVFSVAQIIEALGRD